MKKPKVPKKHYGNVPTTKQVKRLEPKEPVSFDALMRGIMSVKVEKK